MTQIALPLDSSNQSPFDAIRRVDERGEYWTGRDLMPLMDYGRWHEFAAVIEKAMASLALVEGAESAAHHFVVQHSDGGRWGNQSLEDYRLTRFGAYLTAMAGDDTKRAVAEARVYFAVQTRKAETRPNYAELDIDDPAQVLLLADAALRSATLALEERRLRKEAEERLAIAAPKAEQADHFRKADGLHAVASFCNDLQLWAWENHRIRLKHDEIRDFLGDIDFIIRTDGIRKNEPKAEAIKAGWVRPKHSTYDTNTRGSQEATSARLTPKGWGLAWDKAVQRIAGHGSLERPAEVAVSVSPRVPKQRS